MKTSHRTANWTYEPETIAHADKLPPKTVSEQAHKRGMAQGEPLIVAMDALLKYAKAYKARFERPLSDDYVLGPLWLESAKGIRGLLNGDGAVALANNSTTDSKDNGCVEAMFWDAMQMAGFTEDDL